MNSDQSDSRNAQQQELADFAAGFLETRGAVVEKSAKTLEILVPRELSESLGTDEHFFIAGNVDSVTDSISNESGKKVFSLTFGSPLLEKMVDIACGDVPLVRCKARFDYIKTQGFDHLVRNSFSLIGCVGAVTGTAEIRTQYLYVTCRYLAQSDEQKEGLLEMVFNTETGASLPQARDLLYAIPVDYETRKTPDPLGPARIEKIARAIENKSRMELRKQIGPFEKSMNRRLKRDVSNLEEYYEGLRQEMEQSLERPGLSDQLIRERKEKIAMIPDELQSKTDDLIKKYSIRVKVVPCALMIIDTRAVKILYGASVGRQKITLSMIYNPITKALDPLVCEKCGADTYGIRFSQNLKIICPECELTA